jgi:lipoate-protein ligase B
VDKAHFAMIHPCGLPVRAVSMNDLVPSPISWSHVEREFIAAYGAVLGVEWFESGVQALGETAYAQHA